jgi:DNA-binding transcriptional LysR family regulator
VAPGRELIYGVDEDRWELGIGPFHTQMPGHFVTTPFFDEKRRLVAHEKHPRFDALMEAPASELAQLTLLTSYLDDATKRPGSERLRNQFASVWEVSNLEVRLMLAEAGMGITYLSDRLIDDLDGYHPIENLDISTIDRVVGLFYKKHIALSEGAKRFIAICQRHFPSA